MVDLGYSLRNNFIADPCKRRIRAIGRNIINKERLNFLLMHESDARWSVDDELEERYPKVNDD